MASVEGTMSPCSASRDPELSDILNLFSEDFMPNEPDDLNFSRCLEFDSASSRHTDSRSGSEFAAAQVEAPAVSLRELHMHTASPALRIHSEGHKSTQNRPHTTRYSTEAKLARNREAQRRFKLKQKTQVQTFKDQLAATTASLRSLEEQRHKLLSKNALLNKIMQLQVKSLHVPSIDDELSGLTAAERRMKQNLPVVTLSLWEHPHTMTLEQLRQLSLPQLSSIWTDYIHELGACLLQLHDSHQHGSTDRLNTLMSEAFALAMHRSRFEGKVSRPIMTVEADASSGPPSMPEPDENFYRLMMMSGKLSEEQADDLLHIRQLLITRRCVLSVGRKAVVHQLSASDTQVLNPIDNIVTTEDLTTALRRNAAEDHELFYTVVRAVYRGVLSNVQVAELWVHAYPYVTSVEVMLEVLAAQRGAPSKGDLVASARQQPMAAEWRRFVAYSEVVRTLSSPDHLPLSTCPLAGDAD